MKKEQIDDLMNLIADDLQINAMPFKKYCYEVKATHQIIRKHLTEQLKLHIVSSSSKPEPPKPPLSRMIRDGVGRFCKNCDSTMSKSGFLMLFGKRYCDNKKCPQSKPEKNYY